MRRLNSGFSSTIDEFLDYRRTLGFTTEAYHCNLGGFDRFCENHYPKQDVLEKEIVFRWLDDLSQYSHNALAKKATAIRQYGKYLVATGREGYILPANYVSHKSNFAPYTFTEDELHRLFGAIDSLKRIASRDKYAPMIIPVLFRLLYTCGLRPQEGRCLKSDNINLETGEILVIQNKSRRQRIVVMSDDMLRLCRQYNAWRAKSSIGSEYFFALSHRRPFEHECLCRTLRRCWEAANPGTSPELLPRIRPYDLRHQYASSILHKWLDEGRNLNVMFPYLRAFMGHILASDTAYYIHILPEKLLRAHGVNWSKLDQIIPEVSI